MYKITTKIGSSLRNLRDRIRTSVSLNTRNVLFFFAIFLVVFLSIAVRTSPVIRPPTLIKAFDPWIQYYNAKYLSEHTLYEYFHWHDEKSWHPGGVERGELRPGLTFTVVIIYKILTFIGIPITLYEVCYYFPAFMGGLTVLTIYFLGKEILDRNCGLIAAFFLAFNPGHMQRTMCGFFDNETIGVLSTLLTLLFFLKTLNTGRFSYSIIGGAFLGYLSLSWGGYQYLFYILPIFCVIIILLDRYNENVLIAYSGVIGTGLIIHSLFITFDPSKFSTDISIGGIFLFTIVLIVFHMIYIKRRAIPRFYNILLNVVRWGVIPGSIIIVIIIWINPKIIPLGIGSRLNSVLSPLMRENINLVASVAEHAPSAWAVFYYNTLIPLILLPLGIFFCFKRLYYADILLMVFLITLFYFTGSMIRIILLFAPAASLMGAYGLVNVLKIYGTFIGERLLSVTRKRKKRFRKAIGNSEVYSVYLLVGFLCLAQVIYASDISVNQLSYTQIIIGGEYHDWEEALTWMRNNLEGTDVVVSWWDYGYWLTTIGNVTTVNDNATFDSKKIGLVGMAFMQTDEIYSAKILNDLDADYVLVYFGFLISGLGGDEGKWPWMLRICNDHYDYYKEEGYEEDNWAEDSVFDEDDYVNESSGLYRDNWFDSQLVRLMLYDEPTSWSDVDPYDEYLQYYYASQIAGNSYEGISALEDDDGDEWSDHIPDDGEYDFKVFKEVYFSTNHLVKIYKVDYTALDSSFSIKNPKVYDNGFATFYLENDGDKDLTIKKVEINEEEYNFTMGNTQNELDEGDDDIVWVKVTDDYEVNDVVFINVTAEADALEDEQHEFSETTNNFFVTKAEEGAIKINRENSKIEQTGSTTEILLEVENTGDTIVNLESFYADSEENVFNDTEYLYKSTSVIEPGDSAYVKLYNASDLGDFTLSNVGIKGHMIGVKTSLGETDETLFSSNSEDFKLSILSEDREVSPELLATTNNSTYRSHIPIDLSSTGTHVYNNGSVKIKVKNNGDIPYGLDSVYLAEADSVKYGNIFNLTEAIDDSLWQTIDGDSNLMPGQENTIIVDASSLDIDINEEIAIGVTASFGGTITASDVGLIHAIRDDTDVKIIEEVGGSIVSYIMANETGVILAKNTGNDSITIQNIYTNNTVAINLNYLYGDATLGRQECALISFDTQGLKINKTDDVVVNITTSPLAQDSKTFEARENPPEDPNYYDIEIDKSGSSAINNNDLTITIDNEGETSVTLDSVYINDTYIDITEFSGAPYEIAIDESIEITLTNFENYIGSVDVDDKLKILVRTVEGAEDEEILDVD